MGFYTLSIVCAVLIIQFGVEAGEKDNRIPSKSLRGMFVLASVGTDGHTISSDRTAF
jgi:hypothetical protein